MPDGMHLAEGVHLDAILDHCRESSQLLKVKRCTVAAHRRSVTHYHRPSP